MGVEQSHGALEFGVIASDEADIGAWAAIRGPLGAWLRGRLRRRLATRRDLAREHASRTASAYVPLSFAPGVAYQFDWSNEIVVPDSRSACGPTHRRTSRRLQPVRWMLRATLVMKVLRPEWDEQPWYPISANSVATQLTTLVGRRHPPRVDRMASAPWCSLRR